RLADGLQDRRPRRARTGRRQQHARRTCAEPPRGNLRGRARARIGSRAAAKQTRHRSPAGEARPLRETPRNRLRRAAGVAPGRGWAATRSEPTWGRAIVTPREGGWPTPRLT